MATFTPTATSGSSAPAEPVVALVLPIAAEIFVGDGHLHNMLRVLEAELGGDAHLHGETVFARQDFSVESEGHLRLRMQRGRHIDGGGIPLGATEPDVFRARIGADTAEKFPQRRSCPFPDRAP